jgi:pyruvate dehydrogenase E2 component (dihydrolipoamide acetyltransferase)
MSTEFKLPELGEDIASGEIINVTVSEGDAVEKDQTLFEIEAGKATMEIPSPASGTLKALHVKAGDSVNVGQLVAEIEEGEEKTEDGDQSSGVRGQGSEVRGQGSEVRGQGSEFRGQRSEDRDQKSDGGEEKTEEGLSAEVSAKAEEQETEKEPEPDVEEKKPEPAEENPKKAEPAVEQKRSESGNRQSAIGNKKPVSAAPNVRGLARELGLPIHEVPASAPDGHISVEDVKAYARERMSQSTPQAGSSSRNVRAEKMSAVRKATMRHMTHCWATIPHVTQHDIADITKLEEVRKRYAPKAEALGTKLTMTAILIKVIASALKAHPKFNCSIDPEKEEILYKEYYNIGIAMDTPKGLLVPVIADGDRKSIVELAVELRELTAKAREGKLSADDLRGGTFTFTNLGIIGGSFFTPIVNSPEVAILGTGRASWESGIEDSTPRFRLPLSLSYDHRIIDGADGARFLRWIVDAMEEPLLISLQG